MPWLSLNTSLQKGSSKEQKLREILQFDSEFAMFLAPDRSANLPNRHLFPWTETHKQDWIHVSPTTFKSQDTKRKRVSCPDNALLAFAQLAAFRLNVQRCFISLMTTQTTHVLAEATRTQSFQHQAAASESDQLLLGTCTFPRDDGLAEVAMDEWCSARELREAPLNPGHYYTEGVSAHWFIINDLHTSTRYQVPAALDNAPHARFYFAVPLRSSSGSVLGSCSIVDDRPRWGIETGEMAFMEDLADTITQHLHGTIVRAQRQRSERLIQALGMFNSGKNSLREWWLEQEDERYANAGRHADNVIGAHARRAIGDTEFGLESSSDATLSPRSSPAIENPSDTVGRQRRSRKSTAGKPSSHRQSFDAVENTYSRASNLIREALTADAVAFVDAQVAPPLLKRGVSGDSSQHSDTARDSSETDLSDPETDADAMSYICGSSMRLTEHSSDASSVSKRIEIPKTYLRHLIRRYPLGHIFKYGEDGSLASNSSDSNDAIQESTRKRSLGRRLQEILKDARTVVFFPVRDESNEYWRSAVLVWSTSPFRMFSTAEDLTYLNSFGHSLVSELSRLDALAADEAKGKFISSISHELRSPLHGILAGVEFLQETELTSPQQEFCQTVQNAGQTLLDTVNHLLDFSKLARYGSVQPTPLANDGQLLPTFVDPTEMGVTSTVDLAELTESLVETVVSAYRFERFTHPSARRTPHQVVLQTPTESEETSRASHPGSVSVILDIAKRDRWGVQIQSGAWTRIVTNLVGNALKYTSNGFISVSLHAETHSHTKPTGRDLVRLVVEDTGVGISQKFLNTHLFTPFTQEHSHSSGTGLGLSIVKQIAKDMGASLNVSSRVDKGTTVTFDLLTNLEIASPATSSSPSEAFRKLDPPRLQLLEPGTPTNTNGASSVSKIWQSVLQTHKEWVNPADIPASGELHKDTAPAFVISEDYFAMLAESDTATLSDILTRVQSQGTRLLVLACSIQSTMQRCKMDEWSESCVFVHQPIGPQKLIRAIEYSQGLRDSAPNWLPSMPSNQKPQNVVLDSHGSRQRRKETPSKHTRPRTAMHARSSDKQRGATGASAITSASKHLDEIPDVPDPSINLSKHVMLVEDNIINMKLLVALMKKLDLPHRCAYNGREALDMYRQTPDDFFLILMDLSMPIMDGMMATAKIRETENSQQLSRVTIVALTGLTDDDSRQRALSSGVDEFHTKPIHMQNIKKLVDALSLRS